jgi:hypothetical protein
MMSVANFTSVIVNREKSLLRDGRAQPLLS